jgi:hypothetical protein
MRTEGKRYWKSSSSFELHRQYITHLVKPILQGLNSDGIQITKGNKRVLLDCRKHIIAWVKIAHMDSRLNSKHSLHL